ncbi:putative mediator of RNA polymerase II transcription subunit 29 [Protopterus annectens]|uniref:putative mediator of RNA polymerase II transcription subunit 29 n=1 Tax=Protopterus annectens TaxID=7888 RepID=UPI001CFBD468|nr:putative mediator of RNA polymerase II transcription subunit 29 [Protopterus annectens]
MQALVKNYLNELETLKVDINALDCNIRSDKDFFRYKYDFVHIFSSIDNALSKIRETKMKKLKRDANAYSTNLAYPMPPGFTASNMFRDMNNGSGASNIDSNNTCGNNGVNNGREDESFDDDTVTMTPVVRRSDRLANKQPNNREANNNNNNNNNTNNSYRTPIQGFQDRKNNRGYQNQVHQQQHWKKKGQNKKKR